MRLNLNVFKMADIQKLNVNSTTYDISTTWSKVTGKPSTFAPSSHTHTKSQITDFPSSLPASDVYSWAKAASKPSYTYSEVGAAPASHTHTKSQITDFPSSLPANGGTATYASYLGNSSAYYTKASLDNTISSKLDAKRMSNPSNGTSWTGAIPFILSLKSAGTPVYVDPEFKNGNNSCNVYNNSSNGNVTITRVSDDQNSANSSGYILKIYNNGGTTSPGLGGFCQVISSRAGAVFCQIFRAKIPVGYTVVNAENNVGDNYTTYWLTDRSGTGKWEWYCRITICGVSGSMYSGGHVYLSGTGPVTWYMSYCNLIDLSKGDYDGLKVKYADYASSAVDQTARNAASAAQTTANSKWTYNADTIKGVKVNNAGDSDTVGGYSCTDLVRKFWTNSPGYDGNTHNRSPLVTFSYSNNTPYTGVFIDLNSNGYGVMLNTGYYRDTQLAYRRHGTADDGGMGDWRYLIDNVTIGSQSVNYANSAGSAPASDVYSWAKASSKPTYTYSEVGAAPASHTHTKSQITDFPTIPTNTNQLTNGARFITNSTSYLQLNRANGAQGGISFYSSSYNTWQTYMSNIVAGSGVNGNITPKAGSYVTTWAMRSVIENNSGYGWVWESMANGGTSPSIMMELSSSTGNWKIAGNAYATGFYQSSDERLKIFRDPIKVDLEKLRLLKKNYFKFNDKDELEIGVSAQEIQSLYPEIVSENDEGYLSVAYDKLSVIALKAVDELNDINNKQQKEIDDLKDQLSTIKNILKEKGIL